MYSAWIGSPGNKRLRWAKEDSLEDQSTRVSSGQKRCQNTSAQARASGWWRASWSCVGGGDERGEDLRAVEIVDAVGVAFDGNARP